MSVKIKKDLDQFINKEDIRTMKKDIARLQREAVKKGVSPEKAYELRIEKERRKKEESEQRLITEKVAAERGKEEIRKAEREERDRREAEKLEAEEKITEAAAEAVAVREEEKKEKKKEIIKREKLKKPAIAAVPAGRPKAVIVKEKPKIRKKALLEEKDKLKEIENKLERNFGDLADEKKPLESQKAAILERLKETERSFQIIAVRERKIEEKQRLIEEKEEAAKTPEEKKKIEKERWEVERRRRELEKKRWPWDEKIRQIDKQLNEVDFRSQEVENRVEELIRRRKEIFEREEKIRLELEKIELERELQRVDELEESFEEKKANLPVELNKIEQILRGVLTKENEIEENKKIVETKERSVKEPGRRKELEKERWGIEEKRRNIEARRWGLEEEKHKIENQLKRIERGFQVLLEKRENITKKIKEIDQKLMGVEPEVKETPPSAEPMAAKEEKRPEKAIREKVEEKREGPPAALPISRDVPGEAEKRRMEEAKKRIEILKKEIEKRRDEKEQRSKEEEQKKKEKAEEIAIQEQKRREALKKEEEKRRKLLERFQGKKEEIKKPSPPLRPSRVIRVLPKKPTFKEKLWVRILIVSIAILFLGGISTFWYWFFIVRKQPLLVTGCSTDVDCPEGQICNPEGNCIAVSPITTCSSDADCLEGQFCNSEEVCEQKEPGPVIPVALFIADNERHLTISSSEDLNSGLSLVLQEWQEDDQFTRLIIKDIRDDRILGLKEFFEELLVRVPDGFYQKVENDFTLFIYSQSEGNRLGFVTKIKNYEGLANLLRDQETTMESDFQTLYTLMGKEEPAIIPYFKNAENISGYTGPNFRYQSLTSQDLGICYLTSGDYFVFTSSWKSMEKTVERLGIIGIRLEITTELKKGDKGYEVKLLQTWLAEEGVYNGAIGGNFGPMTEAAVISFQERYASEILAPRGLSKGTGIVDSETRTKLYELYGESGLKPRIDELTTVGLMFGDDGEEVKLLQLWLTEEGVYEGAIGGHFRHLTKAAVISFQEKYASEILTPQTLTRGTGIVDELTLKKLNELYGP